MTAWRVLLVLALLAGAHAASGASTQLADLLGSDLSFCVRAFNVLRRCSANKEAGGAKCCRLLEVFEAQGCECPGCDDVSDDEEVERLNSKGLLWMMDLLPLADYCASTEAGISGEAALRSLALEAPEVMQSITEVVLEGQGRAAVEEITSQVHMLTPRQPAAQAQQQQQAEEWVRADSVLGTLLGVDPIQVDDFAADVSVDGADLDRMLGPESRTDDYDDTHDDKPLTQPSQAQPQPHAAAAGTIIPVPQWRQGAAAAGSSSTASRSAAVAAALQRAEALASNEDFPLRRGGPFILGVDSSQEEGEWGGEFEDAAPAVRGAGFARSLLQGEWREGEEWDAEESEGATLAASGSGSWGGEEEQGEGEGGVAAEEELLEEGSSVVAGPGELVVRRVHTVTVDLELSQPQTAESAAQVVQQVLQRASEAVEGSGAVQGTPLLRKVSIDIDINSRGGSAGGRASDMGASLMSWLSKVSRRSAADPAEALQAQLAQQLASAMGGTLAPQQQDAAVAATTHQQQQQQEAQQEQQGSVEALCQCVGLRMRRRQAGEAASLSFYYMHARLTLCQFTCSHRGIITAALALEIAACLLWMGMLLARKAAAARMGRSPSHAQFLACASDPEWQQPLLQDED